MSAIGFCGVPVITGALVIWSMGLAVAIGGMLWFVKRMKEQS